MNAASKWTPECDVEIEQLLGSKNWEARLAAARAQRAMVLAAKEAEKNTVIAVPDTGPDTDSAIAAAPESPPINVGRDRRPGRTRLYALGLGFGLGAASVAAAASFFNAAMPTQGPIGLPPPLVDTAMAGFPSLPSLDILEAHSIPVRLETEPRPADGPRYMQPSAPARSALPAIDLESPSPIPALSGISIVVHFDASSIKPLPFDAFAAAGAEIEYVQLMLAPSRSHVRFFHSQDAQLAERLAASLNISVQDLTGFSPKPETSVLEVVLATDR